MQQSLNIPPHLKRVTTLPCEMFMSENYRVLCDVAHCERLIHRNMYSMKTTEYLMLKQKKMTLT